LAGIFSPYKGIEISFKKTVFLDFCEKDSVIVSKIITFAQHFH